MIDFTFQLFVASARFISWIGRGKGSGNHFLVDSSSYADIHNGHTPLVINQYPVRLCVVLDYTFFGAPAKGLPDGVKLGQTTVDCDHSLSHVEHLTQIRDPKEESSVLYPNFAARDEQRMVGIASPSPYWSPINTVMRHYTGTKRSCNIMRE